ncbi:MAG: GNAT family N-acetyltransferase [Burkholderiaceae bacterium]|jgi:GNAT superfamily N-acetyltransferase|nr:GNAT family N-acetyltransferase [Burkholderiaceae bacterium]
MIGAPEPLGPDHDISGFESGTASLDTWLVRRAAANQASGASRVFVASAESGKVVGYYALASSAVMPGAATGRYRRNMPDPIPVVVLGRLAVARNHQGRGLGRALFQDAASRVVHAADAIGVRGMIVHALSEEAKDFYLRLGLEPSPLDPLTLMTTLADLRAAGQK